MEKLEPVIFYSIEKTIKMYRQFAQNEIKQSGFDITIDQWLILKTIQDYPNITQHQIAVKVFKDFASVTRIIEALVVKNILKRDLHAEDRRRFALSITKKGDTIIENLSSVVKSYRQKALKGITKKEIDSIQEILLKINQNCS